MGKNQAYKQKTSEKTMLYVNACDIGKDDLFFVQLLLPSRFQTGKYIGKKSIDDLWILFDFSLPSLPSPFESKTITVAERENAIVEVLKKKQIRAYTRDGKIGPKPAKKRGLTSF